VIWGNVVATLVLLFSLLGFGFGIYRDYQTEKQSMNSRLTVMEVTVSEQRKTADERNAELRASLRGINTKLDKLISRMIDDRNASR